MIPTRGDYGKAQRRLEIALSSCWHQTDPASGSPVSAGVLGDAPGSFARSDLTSPATGTGQN